jgi:hypothetical protein
MTELEIPGLGLALRADPVFLLERRACHTMSRFTIMKYQCFQRSGPKDTAPMDDGSEI